MFTDFEWSSGQLWIILSSKSTREWIYVIFSDFGAHFGIMLEPCLVISSSKVCVFPRHVSGQNLYWFWSSCGVVLGDKVGPFGSSRALEKIKCDFAKMLVLPTRNLCFWGSDASRTRANRTRERRKKRLRFRCVFEGRFESILNRFWAHNRGDFEGCRATSVKRFRGLWNPVSLIGNQAEPRSS